MEKIDFILPWVDGGDPKWRSLKENYLHQIKPNPDIDDDANAECRYRDMGLLKYWFRGVERFAPWVNKVFFVTCGQKPDWLNVEHPKLVLVNHEDFIPSKYLPTFNSSTIEDNFHRIPDLSEQFVLFNDDVFLLKPINSQFFFRKGAPVLPCNMYISRYYGNSSWSRVCLNDYCTVNEHFDIKQSIWDNRRKWFSISKLGVKLAFMNYVRYQVNKTFCVKGYEHLANPHLKSTFQEVWSKCPAIMEASSLSRFRSDVQVNQWLMVAWNLAKGSFYPVREGKRGVQINVSTNSLDTIRSIIEQQKLPLLCTNDTFANDDFEHCFYEIGKSFETILPQKSSFEK